MNDLDRLAIQSAEILEVLELIDERLQRLSDRVWEMARGSSEGE